MSLAQIISDFNSDITQCETLISNAHKVDANGVNIMPALDRQQITVAAFLNLFIAWETFLESSLAEFMMGASTLNGTAPTKYVSPPDAISALLLLKGINRYFDYGNHQNVRKMVPLLFNQGYPL